MRTLVAVVTTSVLTALAVHVVDAKAAGSIVEASSVVIRDAQGNARVSIDEHGMTVVDRNGTTRIGVRVIDEAGDAVYGPVSRAQVFVAPAADLARNYYEFGSVEMTDGVDSAVFLPEPRITVSRNPVLDGVSNVAERTSAAVTTIGPGKLALADASNVDRVTLQADRKTIVVKDRNGRVRFRK
jgi:hypothetical protein